MPTLITRRQTTQDRWQRRKRHEIKWNMTQHGERIDEQTDETNRKPQVEKKHTHT